MKKISSCLLLLFLVIVGCKSTTENKKEESNSDELNIDFTIAFGSCNKQWEPNDLWDEILKNNPDIWIWGGDIIYSDTNDMEVLEEGYTVQKQNEDYSNFISKVEIMGTWDDHDYGVNDGGKEYSKKAESQQLFLDFLEVPKNSPRRNQEGVYFTKDFTIKNKSIKIIILDTRYFRDSLTKNDDGTYKRYKPNNYGEGTILGEKQWNWLETTLENSTADFHIITSSIQILSGEHGWETWANMPHEVDKLTNLLVTTKAKNVITLSGDRHISDFSKKEVVGLSYPLVDFTSSGLTHSSTNNSGEDNKYRIGNMVNQRSFGLLKFDLTTNTVIMEMRGVNNDLQQLHIQNY